MIEKSRSGRKVWERTQRSPGLENGPPILRLVDTSVGFTPRCTGTIVPEKPVPMIATRKVRVRSGSSRAPSPMEKAFPRREHNFVRGQTDDDDDKHDADNLVHRI